RKPIWCLCLRRHSPPTRPAVDNEDARHGHRHFPRAPFWRVADAMARIIRILAASRQRADPVSASPPRLPDRGPPRYRRATSELPLKPRRTRPKLTRAALNKIMEAGSGTGERVGVKDTTPSKGALRPASETPDN